jgi:hypothetical protein
MLRTMLSDFYPQIGTVLARIEVRDAVGQFDESLIAGQDLDWLLRMARGRSLGFVAMPSVLVRARPWGSYDALQRARIGYARRVFLRHALPEWRIWGTPSAFCRAYSGAMMHLYNYFSDAASERAEGGERKGALRAIATAFRIFPLRAFYHLVVARQLRKALWTSVWSSGRG